MNIWSVKFIVKIWQGALNQHMQVSKGESRHACMHWQMQIIEIYRVQCFDVSRQLVQDREV